MPEGNGKELVQTSCTRCHALNRVTNSWGYTREGWDLLTRSMVALPEDQAAVVADYLAKNFPEKPAPAAVVIPGSVSVSIKEWIVPSLGSRPHDPLAAADGAIWWTGLAGQVNSQAVPWYVDFRGNRVGSFDPVTMEIREYLTRSWASTRKRKSSRLGSSRRAAACYAT